MRRRRASFETARGHLAAGRLELAARESAAVLASRPDDAEARRLAAAIAVARERWEEGLEHADAALKEAAKDPWLHFARARSLLGLGRLDDAKKALHRSRDLDPADPGLYELEATILRSSGATEEALDACEGALALDPHRASAYAMKADLLDALERGDEAVELLRDAVRKLGHHAGDHGVILTRLAEALSARGEDDEARVARDLAAQLAKTTR